MFVLKLELDEVPFLPDDLVKVNRGMNMVKVSVGEHHSEPAEVYIATARDGGNLSTYIVFYLTEPGVRALYGFDGNPYPPPRRIDVETEALEFVEEMGAILEDIGWETMSAENKMGWLSQQLLFSPENELAEMDPEPGEVESDDILEEIQIVEPLSVETEDVVGGEIEPGSAGEPVRAAEMEEDPEENDVELKRTLDGGDGKIVFAEDQFDEMLKKAFINPSDDVSAGGPDPGKEQRPPEIAEVVTAEPDPHGSPAVEEFSDAERILRFLSKM